MIEKVLDVVEGMVGCSAVEVKVTEDVEIKDLSKSVYEYRVNGKAYKVSYVQFVPAGCMSLMERVVYIKACPRIAYVESETNSPDFLINAFCALIIAVMLVILGVICIV